VGHLTITLLNVEVHCRIVLKEFLKSLNIRQSYEGKGRLRQSTFRKSLLPQAPYAPRHAVLCWKMKNSFGISQELLEQANSITLQLILLTNLDSVVGKYQTDVMSITRGSPTDAISDWALIRRLAFYRYVFLVDGYAYSRSFCVLLRHSHGKYVLSVTKMILTSLSEYFQPRFWKAEYGSSLHSAPGRFLNTNISVHKVV